MLIVPLLLLILFSSSLPSSVNWYYEVYTIYALEVLIGMSILILGHFYWDEYKLLKAKNNNIKKLRLYEKYVKQRYTAIDTLLRKEIQAHEGYLVDNNDEMIFLLIGDLNYLCNRYIKYSNALLETSIDTIPMHIYKLLLSILNNSKALKELRYIRSNTDRIIAHISTINDSIKDFNNYWKE